MKKNTFSSNGLYDLFTYHDGGDHGGGTATGAMFAGGEVTREDAKGMDDDDKRKKNEEFNYITTVLIKF